MPRKIGVYARNRELILDLRKDGWNFRTIVRILATVGEVTSHQNLHKAYLRDQRKNEKVKKEEGIETAPLESYIRSHHPKVFKEWMAFQRAATKQVPPVRKGATQKIDEAAVDRLWETLKKDPDFKKLDREKLDVWAREASEKSAARKMIFQQVSKILEREYTDGSLSLTNYKRVKGWLRIIFYNSPETALEFVNANAGKSIDNWTTSFESAMRSITEKSNQKEKR